MQSNGIIFILSAPSGTGKTTICKLLIQKLPDLKFNISHTTREPRNDEVEGTDYHFTSKKEFEEKTKVFSSYKSYESYFKKSGYYLNLAIKVKQLPISENY